LKELKHASFDEAVDLHLNVDKTGLKGEVELPIRRKDVRVAILDDKLLNKSERKN
jgi:ribosomal protein L1